MKLNRLIRALVKAEGESESAGQKDVIVLVDGAPMPYPDVTSIVSNDNTVEIHAKVFESKP